MEQTETKTARRRQATAFGKRLGMARKKAGFATRMAAYRAIPKGLIAQRTYYEHETGSRVPDSMVVIDQYCELFGVTRDYLIHGNGQHADDLITGQINQLRKQHHEIASQIEDVRFIPIVRASEIHLIKKGILAVESKESLPLPASIHAGPKAFGYEIHPDDYSMVGLGMRNFYPGSFVVVDPDQDISPGNFVLVKFEGWLYANVRQFQSAQIHRSGNPAKSYSLRSANEAYFDDNDELCEILGRVVFTIEAL